MSDPIEFYFDFTSSYALPGLIQLEQVVARHGRSIEMHPIMLSVSVSEVMGLPPQIETPLKGDYVMMDVPRVYAYHGLRLHPPAEWADASPLVPQQLMCWMQQVDPVKAGDAIRAMLVANWTSGSDMSKFENTLPHVVAAGFDEKQARTSLDDPEIQHEQKHRVQAAIDKGVFGSPTMIVDGEMFWGSDRVPIVDRWLETGGW